MSEVTWTDPRTGEEFYIDHEEIPEAFDAGEVDENDLAAMLSENPWLNQVAEEYLAAEQEAIPDPSDWSDPLEQKVEQLDRRQLEERFNAELRFVHEQLAGLREERAAASGYDAASEDYAAQLENARRAELAEVAQQGIAQLERAIGRSVTDKELDVLAESWVDSGMPDFTPADLVTMARDELPGADFADNRAGRVQHLQARMAEVDNDVNAGYRASDTSSDMSWAEHRKGHDGAHARLTKLAEGLEANDAAVSEPGALPGE